MEMNILMANLHILAESTMYNLNHAHRIHPGKMSNGLEENSTRQLNTFLRSILDSQYDTWS